VKYPQSNARIFFRTERCSSCGSPNLDWRSDRRCLSCGGRGVETPSPTVERRLGVARAITVGSAAGHSFGGSRFDSGFHIDDE
jgi:hypothetical protein